MPRSKRASAASKGSSKKLSDVSTSPSQAAQRKEEMERINQLYENWKAGVATQRAMKQKVFDELKESKLKEIDNLKTQLGPSILKMTIGEFMKHNEKPEELVQKQIKEEPMELDHISSTVDQALMDLQEISSSALRSDEKPPARSSRIKKKKAPPKTARKNKQKNPMSMLETPCNSSSIPDWQNTPFYTPQVSSRIGHGQAIPNQIDLNNIIAKVTLVTKTGSPRVISETLHPELWRKFEKISKEMNAFEELGNSTTSG